MNLLSQVRKVIGQLAGIVMFRLLASLLVVLFIVCLNSTGVNAQQRVGSATDETVYNKVPKSKLSRSKERKKSRELRKADKIERKQKRWERTLQKDQSKSLNSGKVEYKVPKTELNLGRDANQEMNSSSKNMQDASRSSRTAPRRKSKEITEGDKISRSVSRRSLDREENKSREISEGKKISRSVSRKSLRTEENKSKQINEGDKISYKVKKSWLNREERASKEMAKSSIGMYKLSRRAMNREEDKSKEILAYKAGYLNTRAEKRARIRSFFKPGEYAPNTPEEKIARARRNSKLAYEYKGDIVVRKRTKNMHPSAAYQGGKVKNSYSQKERYRKRMLKRSRNDNKENLPRYMRKKEKKPRYDDVEKGLWND